MKAVALFLVLSAAAAAPAAAQTFTWEDISGVPGFFTILRTDSVTLLGGLEGFPSENGRIYLSGDRGRTWQQLGLINGVFVELAGRDSVFAAARYVNISNPFGATYQIYISSNRGASWTRILQSSFGASVTSLMVSDSGKLYGVQGTGTGAGTLARWAGSSVWRAFGTAAYPSRFSATVAAMLGTKTFLVGTDAYGIAISQDSGASWLQALGTRRVTAINVDVPGTVYVGTSPTSSVTGGVFVTTDLGLSWQFLGLSDRRVTGVSVDPEGRILASTDAGVFTYAGSGLDWTLTSPAPEQMDRVLALGSETILATAAGVAVYRSEDNGASWEQNGLRGQDISAIAVGADSSIYLGTYGNRAFVSNNNGIGWVQVPRDSICDYVFSFAHSGGDMYACTDCGLFLSTDAGSSWRNISEPAISGGIYAAAVAADGALYAAANFGVFRSTSGGQSWLPTALPPYPVVALASGTSGDLLAATTAQGVYRSFDGGVTWNDVGLGRTDVQTAGINWEGHYFVGVNSGIYVSTDEGTSWVLRALPEGLVYSLAFGGEYGIAGTSAGVYISYDRGTTWQQRNTGLNQLTVLSVGLSSGGNLLAGTYHGGIYRTHETITAAAGAPALPASSRLLQNYPNPFNPSTSIRYQVAAAGKVTLRIYDLLGRGVATLVDERQEPGTYEASWNARDFPSGVYFSVLRTGTVRETRKILLAR